MICFSKSGDYHKLGLAAARVFGSRRLHRTSNRLLVARDSETRHFFHFVTGEKEKKERREEREECEREGWKEGSKNMNTDYTSSVRAARATSPSLWLSPDFEKQIATTEAIFLKNKSSRTSTIFLREREASGCETRGGNTGVGVKNRVDDRATGRHGCL